MGKQETDEQKYNIFSEYAGTEFLEEIRGKRLEAIKLVQHK